VTLVLARKGELDSALPEAANVVYLKREIPHYASAQRTRKEFDWLAAEGADVMYSFCFRSAFLALWLATGLRWTRAPAFLTGLYHPHDALLVGGGRRTWMFPLIADLYRNRIPSGRVLFMNEACRQSNGRDLNVDFKASCLFPIPVSSSLAGHCRRKPERTRIVSVGRLAAFKTYNLLMPAVVKELVLRGHDVRWEVYGDGELAGAMRSQARLHKVENRCFFSPPVPYEKLAEIFAQAGFFVGMGTAAVEAGLCGVPTVVIPAYSKEPVCGGWWHTYCGFWMGEDVEGPVLSTPVVDLLDRGLRLTAEAYEQVARLDEEKSRTFLEESVMPRFMDIALSAGRDQVHYPVLYRLVYRLLTSASAMKNRHG
jgi:glycosyltransferase involved in cell wall biosynthesis